MAWINEGCDVSGGGSALERLPAVFWLGETVGHDIQRFQVVAVSEMTAVNFDVFRTRRRQAGAALPGHDPVSLAVDARGGHGQRLLAANARRFGYCPGGIGAAVK